MEELLVRRSVRLCGLDDLCRAMARLPPAVLLGEFVGSRRRSLEVSGTSNDVCLGVTLLDDSAVGGAECFLADNETVACEGTVRLLDGGFESYFSHST